MWILVRRNIRLNDLWPKESEKVLATNQRRCDSEYWKLELDVAATLTTI